jgi:hypothetical protein
MAEQTKETEKSNGVAFRDDRNHSIGVESIMSEGRTLPTLVRRFVDGVISSDGSSPPPPFLRRVRAAANDTAPKLREASRNSARDLIAWTKQGSSLRALLVSTVSYRKRILFPSFVAFSVYFLESNGFFVPLLSYCSINFIYFDYSKVYKNQLLVIYVNLNGLKINRGNCK